eukprot:485419_1
MLLKTLMIGFFLLNKFFCFNHNLMCAIVNCLKMFKKKSPHGRILFIILAKIIAWINKANKNKLFNPQMITCNTTRWRLLCEAFLRSCVRQNNKNLGKIAKENNFRQFFLYSIEERYQIGSFLKQVGSIHDIFESNKTGNSHQVVPQAHFILACLCELQIDIKKRSNANRNKKRIPHQYCNGKYRIPICYIDEKNDTFPIDKFAKENGFEPKRIDFPSTLLVKKCLSITMLSTYVNKIKLKHWISTFLCGPTRDFHIGYNFLNGVKPKNLPIIKTKSIYNKVIIQLKQDIINIQIWDKYCEWKGFNHSGNNQSKPQIIINHNISKSDSNISEHSALNNLLK